jgi:hypothetical protein
MRRAVVGIATALVLAACTPHSAQRTATITLPATSPVPARSWTQAMPPLPPLPSDYRAARRGALPGGSTRRVAGVPLPPGHRVTPDPRFTSGHRQLPAVAWISDYAISNVGELWIQFSRRFSRTGLWPIVLKDFDRSGFADWRQIVGAPVTARVAGVDVAALEKQAYHQQVHTLDPGYVGRLSAPYGDTFPGLAPPPSGPTYPTAAEDVARPERGWLALVPVTRPADVVAAIGWSGVANYNVFSHIGPADISAILRSWQTRYGAVPVLMDADGLVLGVRRPPSTQDEARRAAAERIAACSDQAFQNEDGLIDDANKIRGHIDWFCWWD